MIILIPAYEPDARLTDLVLELQAANPSAGILVVDDGSGPHFAHVFAATDAAGATVIGYGVNRGKGHALKLGLRFIQKHFPGQDIVCADSDGQHTVTDILRIAARVREADGAMILGGRRFTGMVPARSRLGNTVSRQAFRLATGVPIHDTQTGLRGYPAGMIDWLLSVKGNRFEYELNLLLRSRAAGIAIDEVEIETVYLEHNASSHFRPIVDSVKVFTPLLAYLASSLGAFVIDAVGLVVLFALTNSLFVSVVGARLVSASVNFLVNRHAVFHGERGSFRRDLLRYLALAGALLASSYVWLYVLTQWGTPLVVAKLITDVTLYIISFKVQRRFVFAKAPIIARAVERVSPSSPQLSPPASSHAL
ncbi:MAG: GtrA family protein [Salinibacterium sp.]|nr:GtrA family protein [Salinibacterium sp.]